MNSNFSPAALAYVLPTISHLLSENLLEKKAIIDWSDKIVLKEKEPDIFFIELSLMHSKSLGDIASHLSSYVKADTSFISGKAVLACILRKFVNAEILFPDIIYTLYHLDHEITLSENERNYIQQLDHDYDECCQYTENQESLLNIEKNVFAFLRVYKEYNLSNFENWQTMDDDIDRNFNEFVKSNRLTL